MIIPLGLLGSIPLLPIAGMLIHAPAVPMLA
jgi:hypothetical protein